MMKLVALAVIVGLALLYCKEHLHELGSWVDHVFMSHEGRETQEEEKKLSGARALQVHNINGSVTVRNGTGPEIVVHAVKRARTKEQLKEFTVEVAVVDGVAKISTHYASKKNSHGSVEYAIEVPQGVTSVHVETTNGAIDVEGVEAYVLLCSKQGEVTARNIRGAVTASTANGAVTVENVADMAKAESSNGKITMTDLYANADALTRNGSIDVRRVTGSLQARTDNGSITVEHPGKVSDLKTQLGSITVTGVAKGSKVDAVTSLGSVTITDATGKVVAQKSGNGSVRVEV